MAVWAVSMAEVVALTETMFGPLTRELMVALVRRNITVSCSSASELC